MISGLYLITDAAGGDGLPQRVALALQGGARMVQYRDKGPTGPDKVAAAQQLRQLCRAAGALFLVNDDPLLARECEADGVHLGQGDGSVAAARAILGPGRLVGVSTRTVAQARQAEADGADYIGLGSIYPTGTKLDAQQVGLERLRQVRAAVRLPIVAIGGIERDNAGAAIDAGADAVAVVSAVMGAPRPELAARELALLFLRRQPLPRGRVLTIAGSDPGGGAGIQADLKTITLLGGYGMSAITALTVQNTLGVTAIHPTAASFVEAQIEAVLADLGAEVIKTGMLHDAGIIEVTAAAIRRYHLPAVVDPVMIAKGGAPLLQPEAIDALRRRLLPVAYLVTPNLPEAEALTGLTIDSEERMAAAARHLQQLGTPNVLIKGGHLPGEAVDLLLAGATLHRFSTPRLPSPHTHGTGCSFAAAIATLLAQGLPLPLAVQRAKDYITIAIRTAVPRGGGHGPVNHWQAAQTLLHPNQS